MLDELFMGTFTLLLLFIYFGIGGGIVWLLDKILRRFPRYQRWLDELLGETLEAMKTCEEA